MFDFLDAAEQLFRTGRVTENNADFQKVFESKGRLQAVHSKSQLDINNIESVFNALETARILRKFPGLDGFSIEEAIESMKVVIAATLEQLIQFPIKSTQLQPPRPYDRFADLIKHLLNTSEPKHKVAVLTFNYDLAADYALYSAGLGPEYGLGPSVGFGVPLLKLHGSMNWATCNKCQQVVPWHLKDYLNEFRFNFAFDIPQSVILNVGSNLKYFQHCGITDNKKPFIVPPTWNKTDHHEAIRVIWECAAKELSDAENIFLIGYSLPETDAFFRTLYALGTVGPKPLKRIWVFDPDTSGSVRPRFQNLMGPGALDRFKFHQLTFEQAIPIIHAEFPKRQ